jgi:hypothetical protein
MPLAAHITGLDASIQTVQLEVGITVIAVPDRWLLLGNPAYRSRLQSP